MTMDDFKYILNISLEGTSNIVFSFQIMHTSRRTRPQLSVDGTAYVVKL